MSERGTSSISGGNGAGPAVEHAPSFPRVRRLDEMWYRGERALCGAMFLIMSLLVSAAVVADVFGTRREPIDVVVAFCLCYMATRTRRVKEGESAMSRGRSVIVAGALTALVCGTVYLYTEIYPGGFVWAQKLALVMMLWVALLGASMATYERAHLSLELGEKLWPRRVLHLVKAFAHAITSAFCLALFVFSVEMMLNHIDWGTTVKANLWLPYWVAVAIMPYTFGALTVRILAQTFTVATHRDAPVEDQLPT